MFHLSASLFFAHSNSLKGLLIHQEIFLWAFVFYYYDESICNFNKQDDVVKAVFVYLEAMVILFTEKLICIYI